MTARNLPQKYRPKSVDDVIGQPQAQAVLKQLLAQKSLPTTILFSGPSGCGKTSMARVFATAINCQHKTGCGECQSCRLGTQDPPNHPDIIEKNSADARGIDDIRALIGQARFAPQFKARVFILDEVHGLTKQAIDSMLKITEEPPPSTIWCLCTTEVHKLPTVLVGRSTRVPVSLIPPQDMTKHLVKVARLEGLDFKKLINSPDDKKQITGLLNNLCDLSGGRMRDALSLLEIILMMYKQGEKPTLKDLMAQCADKFDLTADHAAVKQLYSVYSKNLKSAVSTAYDMQDNPRSLLNSARWINDKLIQLKIGRQVPYMGYGAKQLIQLLKEKKLSPTLEELLLTQEHLNLLEQRMNLSATPAHMLMVDAMSKIISSK